MAEHKHAEVLRQIADGVPLSEFEVRHVNWKNGWQTLAYATIISNPDEWETRRKPQYIMVNGFKVPKPLDVLRRGQDYFLASVINGDPKGEDRFNNNESLGERQCAKGIVHSTKKAAIAHAKAMLGIDPHFFDDGEVK